MDDDFSARLNLQSGQEEFERARRQGFFRSVLDLFRGKPAELLSFEDVRARLRLHEELYRGVQDIPLDKIVGSVGRYHEFTRAFFPKERVDQMRWSRVYAQAMTMEGLPPIEVYQVGDVYFVRDGNHRVSVARRLGATMIEAEVIELPSPIGLRPDASGHQLDDAALYVEFLQRTGLARLGPNIIPLHLSETSRYDDLLGHIKLHQSVRECKMQAPLTFEAAARDWYDNVYAPVIDPVCEYNILDYFPERTKADLFLWSVDHLCDMKADCAATLHPYPLQTSLAEFLQRRAIPLPASALITVDEAPDTPDDAG